MIEHSSYNFTILMVYYFYVPNILQPLLITFYWPIDFYFVKECVFILVLSLTRNVTYFTDEVPKDFLATSTTFTQYIIQVPIAYNRKKLINNNQSEIMKVITRIKNKDIDEIMQLIDQVDNNKSKK
jgi:hypothetical protein